MASNASVAVHSQNTTASAQLPAGPAGTYAHKSPIPQRTAVVNGSGQQSVAPYKPVARVAIDDEWRRWIAENLMIGRSPESILEAMKSRGLLVEESAQEIKTAMESPYVRGSELLFNRMKKRDWLLAVYRKCNRLRPAAHEIERRDRLTREVFLRDYYSTNRPLVITGMMDDWPAMRKWDLDYLVQTCGNREVDVRIGRTTNADYEIARETSAHGIRFGDIVEKINKAAECNDFYLSASKASFNRKALAELWEDIIHIPEFLASDPAGSYLWMGAKGTITPFYHDLANSFMAQVIGRKQVKLAPLWDMPFMANHLHCFSTLDGRAMRSASHPGTEDAQVYELVLNPGELLFLPVGCLHYVHAIEASVTIAFTNFVFDNDFSSFYNSYCPV